MSQSRRGFSLMEVLLATSILLGSSIALIELATIGRKQATAAYDNNIAQLLCQAKLEEIVAGIEPLQSVDSVELEDDPGWFYSVDVEPLDQFPQLVAVSVSVFQMSETLGRPVRFELVRWLPDSNGDEFTPEAPFNPSTNGTARPASTTDTPRRTFGSQQTRVVP